MRRLRSALLAAVFVAASVVAIHPPQRRTSGIERAAWASSSLPVPINVQTDRLHCAGDSITQGQGNTPTPGGLCAPIAWQIWTHQLALAAPAAGWKTSGSTTPPTLMQFTQDGLSGTGIQALADNVATRVIAYNPTVVFIQVSSNDWGRGSDAAWTTPMTTVANAIDAQLPGCKVVLIPSLFGSGEQWTTASGWGSNPDDSKALSINNLASTWIAGRNANYYWLGPLRGAAVTDAGSILKWEHDNNTPEPGAASGLLANASSPIHPIITFGEKVIAGLIVNNFVTISY